MPQLTVLTGLLLIALTPLSSHVRADLRAGAAIVDVTPSKFPVLVNGGMTARTASEVITAINARAIVLDDGDERIGIVVVDSCMMPRPLLDEAKQLAAQQTQLQPDHILICATHTHTAPSSMGALGTDADADYLPVLRAGIAEALIRAEKNLEPARVGWGVENAEKFTALRRWILRPDRLVDDPFGNPTVRATMHAGSNPDNVVGESGPEDPDLCMISVQAVDGRPIAVLANFSMHYFSGQKPLAADYFGLFCDGLQEQLGHGDDRHPPFVGLMSHGCSGDIWRRDYRMPKDEQNPFPTIEEYTAGLLKIALKGYQSIQYRSDADLAMHEARPVLNYRVPDRQRLEWAQNILADMGDRPPRTQSEVYAREQIILHERQSTEIVVQGLRIGDIGIATTPNETYALTGLKVKHQSPLARTMVIELANGGDGYIPPPEQHLLGGYNTWAARSAGLEVRAEPVIAETALQLLEKSAEQPRRKFQQSSGRTAKAVLAAKPLAWFRLDEMAGAWARDSSGNRRHSAYEAPVAFFLQGPQDNGICESGDVNRAAHFAGGRLLANCSDLSDRYSISLWAWNGMPVDAREVAGWMYSRGRADVADGHGDHVGISGASDSPGRLIFSHGDTATTGTTEIPRWTWVHVVVVRDAHQVKVYLNGNPEIAVQADAVAPGLPVFFGGRCDGSDNWEGRLDEIAVFDRVLSESEIRVLGGGSE